ncbi:MAG: MarP family serine protease [Rubrobacteraceae bacterium]
MSLLDWLIVALIVLLAIRGFSSGFVAGAFSLAGLGVGAYLGSRLAAYLVRAETDLAGYGPLILLLSAVLFAVVGRALAGTVGGRIGASIRRVPGLGALDGLGGAALGAAVGIFFVWVLGAFALQSPLPVQLQGTVERSEVLGEVNERLPSGLLLDTISRFDPMPQIEGPRPDVAEPELPNGNSEQVIEEAARSVVQIVATGGSGSGASGYGSSGSGWVAAPEIVVTNAHVVAGSDRVSVRQGGSWRGYEAEVVAVDQTNDVAVLEVNGLDLPALPTAEAEPGESVAILGYPYGGPLEAEPGRIGGTAQTLTSDAYGNGPISRYITSIRGEANPGNSGGPAVNQEGEVVGTVFASAGYRGAAYAIPPSVVAAQLELAQDRVATTTNLPTELQEAAS